MKLVHHPVDTFLGENENVVKLPPEVVGFIVMEIKGAKAGEDVTYKLIKPSATAEENLNLYRQFGTARIGVALPAIVGAKMCVAGEAGRGVIAPECLDAKRFLKMMADAGAPVQFEEMCSKEVTVR
jgi:saccharopine dehydrogenase-like NADP-dependent oxidoreductase